MKTFLFGLLAIVGFSFAIERVNVDKNVGASIPLFSSNDAEINLDTSESDTSTRWLFVGNRSIRTYTDTIGTAWLRCDDSTGTDSIGVRLLLYGNPHPEGKALWEIVDSASVLAASGTETQSQFVVKNSKRYQILRGVITNRKNSAVGLKAVCRNVRLNIPPILNPTMP
jgi:hypothetical protein